MAQQRAQRHEVHVRTQRGRQQPVTVEGLEPLTVQDVTLALGNAFDGLALMRQQWRPRASSSSNRVYEKGVRPLLCSPTVYAFSSRSASR